MTGILRVLVLAFTFLGPIVGKILKSLGFGLLAYAGASQIVSIGESYIFDNYNGMPSALWSIMTMMGVDKGVKIVFAAVAARIAMQATFATRPVWSAPPGSGGGGSGTLEL